jgi:hypothetical protein
VKVGTGGDPLHQSAALRLGRHPLARGGAPITRDVCLFQLPNPTV